jgi:type VI secretion system protein ImpF
MSGLLMTELLVQDRLQPSLLDRLIDEDPSSKVEADEKKVLTKQALRQAVLRDLVWLFNASGHSPKLDAKRFPNVARSVVNYGLPDFSGQFASSVEPGDLEQMIRAAVMLFEPRILADTLEISAEMEQSTLDAHNCLSLNVRGMLWAQPVPIEFLMRSQIDLEEGRIKDVSVN